LIDDVKVPCRVKV